MTLPRVSVIIPTYRDWDRLAVCLDALRRQTLPQDHFEILVANNDPDRPVPDALRLPDNATLLTVAQPGSYAARNAAVQVAKGEIFAFTDSDCVPEPQWLAQALGLFDADPEVSRIAGDIRHFVTGGRWTAAALFDRTFHLQQKRHFADGQAATANAFAYRKVFDAVGSFDPKLLTGGDLEWSRRARDAGFKIAFCADAVVKHPARDDFHQVLRKSRRLAGGTIARKRKRGDRIIVPHLDKLLPPLGKGLLLLRSDDLTAWEALRVWFVLYATRLAFVGEQVRLIVFRGEYERR